MRWMVLLLICVPAAAQDAPIAFVGAHVLPGVGPALADGTVVVHKGRIVAVGPTGSVEVPAAAEVRRVAGKILMPGLVDTHSHVGGPAGGDRSGALHPDVRVIDSIDPRDSGFRKALAGGLTTLNVMSGSGHLLSGQTVYLKLRRGDTIEDLVIRLPDGTFAGGVKMANGTNSMGSSPFPGTRGKSAALVRQMFLDAQDHRAKIEAARAEGKPLPKRNLGHEALIEVLEGRRVVHHHTHRHDDIVTVLRLSKEFGFRVVLHHVSEAWKVADEIAAAKVGCSLIVIDSPGGKLEATDMLFETGMVLEKAGVAVAFHTDDPITDSRLFLRSAALAVRAGMSREGALAGLTIAGARMLDLEDRVGSLEVGKDADLVVLSGDPFSIDTRVLETWVEGRKVFDLADPQDRLHALGGDGASRRQAVFNGCCFGEDR